jgi:hypothetical protein
MLEVILSLWHTETWLKFRRNMDFSTRQNFAEKSHLRLQFYGHFPAGEEKKKEEVSAFQTISLISTGFNILHL